MDYKLGKFLESERKKRDMSLRDFADEIGISHTYLKNLETGVNPQTKKSISPTLDKLESISKSLNVSLDYLVELAGYQYSDNKATLNSLKNSNSILDTDFDMLTDEEIDDTFTAYLKKQNRVMFFEPESDRSPDEKRAILKELAKKEKKRQEKINKLSSLSDDLLDEVLDYAEFQAQKKSKK